MRLLMILLFALVGCTQESEPMVADIPSCLELGLSDGCPLVERLGAEIDLRQRELQEEIQFRCRLYPRLHMPVACEDYL